LGIDGFAGCRQIEGLVEDVSKVGSGDRNITIFGVADLRYDGLRNWDILELKVVD